MAITTPNQMLACHKKAPMKLYLGKQLMTKQTLNIMLRMSAKYAFIFLSLYHIKNTRDFVQQVQGIQLQPNECISSYDVSSLLTSVHVDPVITIIKR